MSIIIGHRGIFGDMLGTLARASHNALSLWGVLPIRQNGRRPFLTIFQRIQRICGGVGEAMHPGNVG